MRRAFPLLALASLARAEAPSLRVRVSIPGAAISIDDRDAGASPMAEPLRVRAGKHTVRVRKPGFAEYLDVVRVSGATVVDVDLLPFAAAVTLSGDAGAAVFVDGGRAGTIGADGAWRGELMPGRRALRVERDGRAWRADVDAIAGQDFDLRAAFAAPGEPARPWYRRWWVWTAVGGAAVVAAAAVAVPLARSSPDPVEEFHPDRIIDVRR